MSRYYNDPQEGLIPTSGYIIDSKNQTTTFTSSDVANTSDATSWTAVSKLDSGETHKSIFAKVSQMFKNVRFLYKMLGTTDISQIGDGTVTGGLSNLKSSLNNKMASDKIVVENKSLTTDQYGQFSTAKSGYSLIGCILQAGGTTPFWCKIRHAYTNNNFYVIVYSGVLETDGLLTNNTSNYTLVWVKNS